MNAPKLGDLMAWGTAPLRIVIKVEKTSSKNLYSLYLQGNVQQHWVWSPTIANDWRHIPGNSLTRKLYETS